MQKKEKVVAIRLTQTEYDLLEWGRVNSFTHEPKAKTMSQFVAYLLATDINQIGINRAVQVKKAEAAAKRKATKEAKKAANDAK